MWRFFKKKPNNTAANMSADPLVMHFKSNEAAFEYACNYMTDGLTPGIIGAALVAKAWRRADGVRYVSVFVARAPDGEAVVSVRVRPDVPNLKAGDLVAIGVGKGVQELDPASIGTACEILAKLKPVHHAKLGWARADAY